MLRLRCEAHSARREKERERESGKRSGQSWASTKSLISLPPMGSTNQLRSPDKRERERERKAGCTYLVSLIMYAHRMRASKMVDMHEARRRLKYGGDWQLVL